MKQTVLPTIDDMPPRGRVLPAERTLAFGKDQESLHRHTSPASDSLRGTLNPQTMQQSVGAASLGSGIPSLLALLAARASSSVACAASLSAAAMGSKALACTGFLRTPDSCSLGLNS